MKRTALWAGLLILMASLSMGMSMNAAAETYTGSIVLMDGNDVEQNYFEPSEYIYFELEAEENGAPLQQKTVNVRIVGDTEGEQHTSSYMTDDYGRTTGYWWATNGNPHPLDTYTITLNYTNLTGTTTLATETFRVYNPIPNSVEIETRDDTDTVREYFSDDQSVQVHITVTDQHGNPFDGVVYYDAIHEEDQFRYHVYLDTDQDGEDVFYIYPYNYYWDDSDPTIYGEYLINITDDNYDTIGDATFHVVSLDIEITPQKGVYTPGEEIDLHVSTTMMGSYTINITNKTGIQLSGASWNAKSGTTDWRKTYTLPSNAADGLYSVAVWQGGVRLSEEHLMLQKFSIYAGMDRDEYLPGQRATLYFTAVDNHLGAPIDVDISVELRYRDTDQQTITKDIDDAEGSSGTVSFTVPKDAATSGGWTHRLEITGDDNNGHTTETSINLRISDLRVTASTDAAVYRPGDRVYVTITSSTSNWGSSIPGVSLDVEVLMDDDRVGERWSGDVDENGEASFFYYIPEDADDADHIINVTGELNANGDQTDNSQQAFEVDGTPRFALYLYPQAARVLAGETVTVE
ncbi:MAG: hypothetical protein KAT70_06825, partial [Thermoplasmata archaeon]|nr:hypothetical protein [Thermoplasmata archaeon]